VPPHPPGAFTWEFNTDDEKKMCELTVSFGGRARPLPDDRYPCTIADPRFYSGPASAKGGGGRDDVTEDDVIHKQIVHDFDATLTQEDAERLLSYLTAPYLRLPLVLSFFAEERLGALFNRQLQAILR
jgi:hypothetical protein